jgi:hypothetical protein
MFSTKFKGYVVIFSFFRPLCNFTHRCQ